MRVVRHVQHEHRPARHDLEAARQLHHRQAGTHGLRGDGHTVAQRFERGQCAGRIQELVRTPQRRIGEAVVALLASRPAPLLRVALDAEVAAGEPQVGADLAGVIEHAARRHRVADDDGPAGAHHTGLFPADGFAVGAEVVHMIDVDARDDGAVAVDRVHRIEHRHVDHSQLALAKRRGCNDCDGLRVPIRADEARLVAAGVTPLEHHPGLRALHDDRRVMRDQQPDHDGEAQQWRPPGRPW